MHKALSAAAHWDSSTRTSRPLCACPGTCYLNDLVLGVLTLLQFPCLIRRLLKCHAPLCACPGTCHVNDLVLGVLELRKFHA